MSPAGSTAILSALPEEQAGLLAQLEGARRHTVASRDFWLGRLQGRPVVLALSRIGKVSASLTASVLIGHLGVSRIVFTGVAGGLAPGVKVGDVVVAQDFIQHDLDASPLFPRYEVPLYGRARFARSRKKPITASGESAILGATDKAPKLAKPSNCASSCRRAKISRMTGALSKCCASGAASSEARVA